MTMEDVLGYLTMTDASEHVKIISQLEERTAYDLYESKEYLNLDGFILTYIYEVVVSNIKLNHFGVNETQAHIYCSEKVLDKNRGIGDSFLRTHNIKVSNVKDMRILGEEHFKEFIQKYVHSLAYETITTKKGYWSIKLAHQIEKVAHTLNFSVVGNTGVLSQESYHEVKTRIEEDVKECYEALPEEGKSDRVHMKRMFSLGVATAFRKAEEQKTYEN